MSSQRLGGLVQIIKVALCQKILEVFYVAKINIPVSSDLKPSLAVFADVQYFIYADIVGWSEKA